MNIEQNKQKPKEVKQQIVNNNIVSLVAWHDLVVLL